MAKHVLHPWWKENELRMLNISDLEFDGLQQKRPVLSAKNRNVLRLQWAQVHQNWAPMMFFQSSFFVQFFPEFLLRYTNNGSPYQTQVHFTKMPPRSPPISGKRSPQDHHQPNIIACSRHVSGAPALSRDFNQLSATAVSRISPPTKHIYQSAVL